MSGRYLVTSALPYANGPIHFGHVVGAYLPADIYTRYLRMKGEQVMFVCGTDEHGVAITINAEQAHMPYRAFVDKWHGEIKKTFDRFEIEFDIFSGTARNEYHATVSQHFFRTLDKNGYVKTKVEKQWYCLKDKMFLADRYIEGVCPNCGAAEARGDECKKCAQWIDALALKEARCKICGTAPQVRETKHWYLELPKLYRDGVKDWFEGNPNWKPNVQTFVANMLKDLHERPITRDLRWGVPVPADFEGAEGKVLYVWFDAPIGYISNTQELCEKHPEKWGSLADWWQSPESADKPGTRLVHFIGKDNIPFHCIVFPSMLFGMKENFVLPWNVPANEFYNLQGKKFSTSGGWYLDVDDFFTKYSADAARFALIAGAPETADSEFTWEEFQRRNNGELADTIGNLASRTLKFIEARYGGKVPETDRVFEFDQKKAAAADAIGEAIEQFQFRKAAAALIEFARQGNQFFDAAKPWETIKTKPEKCARDVGRVYEMLWSLAILMRPFMPKSADRLSNMLGIPADWKQIVWGDAKLPPSKLLAKKIGAVEVLFPKIEDAQIQEEIAALHARAAKAQDKEKKMENRSQTNAGDMPAPPTAASTANSLPNPAGGLATYEDFTKIQLRIGKVLSAAPVPKADKLLLLQVDLGTEKRQIVAGIAKSYTPESLVGKSVVVVVNLAPKKMMGVESQGMVLAATVPEGVLLIQPEKDAPPGSIVK